MQNNQSQTSRGRGWHGDPTGHAKAGQRGGEVTAKRGSQFFRAIGGKGGRVSPTKFKVGDTRAKEAGRRGGQARSKNM